MSEAGLYGIRVSNEDALEAAITRLIDTNPDLTIDDFLDAIFAVGLISTTALQALAIQK